MSIDRFEIMEVPQLKWFVLISIGLHIIAMVTYDWLPDKKRIETKHPAVKVKYLPPEKKAPPQKLVDIPKPRKIEKPDSSELVARYDSRAHSNRKAKKEPRYRNKKTVVPRAKKSVATPKKAKPIPKKKTVPEPKTTTIEKPFRPYDKGFNLPKKKTEVPVAPPWKRIPGGTQALLDGLDVEKFASMDMEFEPSEDDGEAISLNTKETRYASYFLRIKRQIELAWNYPSEAQRKGITGQLTLRFQISRDGNLMNVRLINGSGYNVLDEAALQAVKSAAPYYPFPVTIDRETLPILANFIYSPRPRAMYFPRR
jgi:protein TonB